ncbi:hypothetical protein [Limosilactobacillus fermentum]
MTTRFWNDKIAVLIKVLLSNGLCGNTIKDLDGFFCPDPPIYFLNYTKSESLFNLYTFYSRPNQLATEVPKSSWMNKTFAKISKNGVPAAAIILSAALVLITPFSNCDPSDHLLDEPN